MHEMCGEDDYSSLPRVAGQAKSIQIQKLEGVAFVPLFFFLLDIASHKRSRIYPRLSMRFAC